MRRLIIYIVTITCFCAFSNDAGAQINPCFDDLDRSLDTLNDINWAGKAKLSFKYLDSNDDWERTIYIYNYPADSIFKIADPHTGLMLKIKNDVGYELAFNDSVISFDSLIIKEFDFLYQHYKSIPLVNPNIPLWYDSCQKTETDLVLSNRNSSTSGDTIFIDSISIHVPSGFFPTSVNFSYTVNLGASLLFSQSGTMDIFPDLQDASGPDYRFITEQVTMNPDSLHLFSCTECCNKIVFVMMVDDSNGVEIYDELINYWSQVGCNWFYLVQLGDYNLEQYSFSTARLTILDKPGLVFNSFDASTTPIVLVLDPIEDRVKIGYEGVATHKEGVKSYFLQYVFGE